MLIKLTNLDLNQKIFFTTLAVILSNKRYHCFSGPLDTRFQPDG